MWAYLFNLGFFNPIYSVTNSTMSIKNDIYIMFYVGYGGIKYIYGQESLRVAGSDAQILLNKHKIFKIEGLGGYMRRAKTFKGISPEEGRLELSLTEQPIHHVIFAE